MFTLNHLSKLLIVKADILQMTIDYFFCVSTSKYCYLRKILKFEIADKIVFFFLFLNFKTSSSKERYEKDFSPSFSVLSTQWKLKPERFTLQTYHLE